MIKTNYSRQEICDCITVLRNFFERVELVDAASCQRVDEQTLEPVCGCAFSVPNRRCDFCVSAQCIAEKGRMSRLRVAGERVYNTTCQYVEVEGKHFALLLANDATEDFCAGADGENVDSAIFADISRMVERYNRWIYRDFITGVYNRRYLEQNYLPTLPAMVQKGVPVNLALVRVNKLSSIHKQFGREAADRLVGYVANLFQQQIDMENPDGVVCRMSGNCFVVSCEGWDRAHFEDDLRRVYQSCRKEFRATMSRCAPYTLTIVTTDLAEAGDGIKAMEILDKRMGAAHEEDKSGVISQ